MTIALYRRYRQALARARPVERFMPFDWVQVPSPLGAEWMAYGQMVREFASELANIINQLSQNARRLEAWAAVVAPLTNHQKLDAAIEFIDAVATVSVGAPYVIKARFAFAGAHLCHQANLTKDGASWLDNLPLDTKIDLGVADRYGPRWRAYNRFKRRVEAIGGREFQRKTHDFRNAYNHRFSPRFVIGLTQIATRQVNPANGRVRYSFGGLEPLDLAVVAELLRQECAKCHAAFDAFQALVEEHLAAIAAARVAA